MVFFHCSYHWDLLNTGHNFHNMTKSLRSTYCANSDKWLTASRWQTTVTMMKKFTFIVHKKFRKKEEFWNEFFDISWWFKAWQPPGCADAMECSVWNVKALIWKHHNIIAKRLGITRSFVPSGIKRQHVWTWTLICKHIYTQCSIALFCESSPQE